jgi:hypothetical protein
MATVASEICRWHVTKTSLIAVKSVESCGRSPQIFQKSSSHFQILIARMVPKSKFIPRCDP